MKTFHFVSSAVTNIATFRIVYRVGSRSSYERCGSGILFSVGILTVLPCVYDFFNYLFRRRWPVLRNLSSPVSLSDLFLSFSEVPNIYRNVVLATFSELDTVFKRTACSLAPLAKLVICFEKLAWTMWQIAQFEKFDSKS